jgi:hypothetical protein
MALINVNNKLHTFDAKVAFGDPIGLSAKSISMIRELPQNEHDQKTQ